MKKATTILVALILAVFGLAACGGGDDEEETVAEETTAAETGIAAGAETSLKLSAPPDGSFAFDKKELNAKAGVVTIEFDNPASLSHDVVLEDDSDNEIGRTDLITQSSDSFTVSLQPGTYVYYCDVPGHREGGMEGNLSIK